MPRRATVNVNFEILIDFKKFKMKKKWLEDLPAESRLPLRPRPSEDTCTILRSSSVEEQDGN